jgi:2-polyprenyl-6-methoxyphenol hydroxylase-like FAD-dependent oxidoreductase
MAPPRFDAIVLGARCAGSPTAMLLARKGYKVLLVDKATFPSDTISTHLIHPPGVAALSRWGLLDQVVATGCPPITSYSFDFGPFRLTGSPGTEKFPVSYGPRRTVLDKLLVDAAAKAGVEVREGYTVEEILQNGEGVTGIRGGPKGGSTSTETARVVIGADGRHSILAQAVRAETYNEKPPLLAAYYTYWSGLPMGGRFEAYIRDRCSFAVWPTNDERTLVIAGWPQSEFEARKKDVEGSYHRVIDTVPAFAKRVRAAKREERFVGTSVPNYFRKPYGPGWVLVGDAGYNKDFITAMGISDAFSQSEMVSNAVDAALSGARPFDAVMSEYQSARDTRALPIYEFTCQLATQDPPPPHVLQLFQAIHGNQEAMDGFARVNSGVTSPAEFFSEENVGRIFAAAQAKASGPR